MKTQFAIARLSKRSTPNVQPSTFKVDALPYFNVERWKLNVERLPKRSLAGAVLLLSALLPNQATADDATPPHHPIPSLMQWEAGGARKDPIESIDHKMSYIVGDLSDQKTDQPVQTQEKKVVAELDTIIKQLEEEQKKSGSGKASANPTKPMQKSTLAKGPGGSGDLHDPRAGSKQWGSLTPKEREQIMQSQTEGFPPGYEAVLSSYYNRLAQEKVGSDSAAEGPTTRPAGN
jgi:hypothetical protein